MILENPFKLLGLRATASGREVRRRFDELAVKAALGATSVELGPDELSRIRQALEDPVQRARHETFWLHSPEQVDPALVVAAGDGLDAAIERLRDAAGRPPSHEQAIALHDLAVLSYSRFLASGSDADASAALGMWASVYASEEYWHYVRQRLHEAADPRLTPKLVDQIRREIPAVVLGPVARRVAALIDKGDLAAGANLLRALRSSGLPPEEIDAAARAAIAPIRARLEDGALALERLVQEIPSSDGPSPGTRAQLEQAQDLLIERVLSVVVRLKEIDPVFNEGVLADRAAAAARRLSVAACNLLDDWAWGYVLIREALATARTPAYVAQLASEQAQVCGSYHHSHATTAADQKNPLVAAAHIELAIPYARSDEERSDWTHLALGARRQGRLTDQQVDGQKSTIAETLERRETALHDQIRRAAERGPETDSAPEVRQSPSSNRRGQQDEGEQRSSSRWRLGRWLVGATILGVAVLGVTLGPGGLRSGDADHEAPPPAAPAALPAPELPTGDSTAGVAAECATLVALESELDRLDDGIAAKRGLVRRIDAQEAPIAAELAKISRDYPSNQLPADVWRRFVPLRAKYTRLEAQSKRTVRDGNALVSVYNEKVETYDRLKEEC